MGELGPEAREIVAADRRVGADDRLAVGTAQRLRTNLTVIGGWAAILDDEWDRLPDERRRSAVQTIRRLVDELLEDAEASTAHARAELDLGSLAPVPLDVRGLVEALAAADDRVIDLTPPGDLVAVADRAALQQVLDKLVENAAAYSPPGTQVVLSARRNPRSVVIEVRDGGPGLPHHVDVFAPFARGPGAVGGGHGLGLYIARELARAMGGDVTAHAPRAGGTTMRVHLPAADR